MDNLIRIQITKMLKSRRQTTRILNPNSVIDVRFMMDENMLKMLGTRDDNIIELINKLNKAIGILSYAEYEMDNGTLYINDHAMVAVIATNPIFNGLDVRHILNDIGICPYYNSAEIDRTLRILAWYDDYSNEVANVKYYILNHMRIYNALHHDELSDDDITKKFEKIILTITGSNRTISQLTEQCEIPEGEPLVDHAFTYAVKMFAEYMDHIYHVYKDQNDKSLSTIIDEVCSEGLEYAYPLPFSKTLTQGIVNIPCSPLARLKEDTE